MNGKISRAVVKRLPRYHRLLTDLLASGIKRTSSQEISEILGSTASQVRQDFNNFGGFGQQGYGYHVEELLKEISEILGLKKEYKTIIVGSGNIGQALAGYQGFGDNNFKLTALFDRDARLVGKLVAGSEILDAQQMPEFLNIHDIDIAYLCVNKEAAQETANILVESGIKAIWNFSRIDLDVPEDVVVENVHLIEELFLISYYLNQKPKK